MILFHILDCDDCVDDERNPPAVAVAHCAEPKCDKAMCGEHVVKHNGLISKQGHEVTRLGGAFVVTNPVSCITSTPMFSDKS